MTTIDPAELADALVAWNRANARSRREYRTNPTVTRFRPIEPERRTMRTCGEGCGVKTRSRSGVCTACRTKALG